MPGGSPQKLYRDLPEIQIRRHYIVFMLILVTPLLFLAFCFSSFLSKLHVDDTHSANLMLPGLDSASFPDCCKCPGELEFSGNVGAEKLVKSTVGDIRAAEGSMGKAGAQTARGMSSVGGMELARQSDERGKGPLRVFVYDLPSNFTREFYQHEDATKTPYASEWWFYQDIMRDDSQRSNSAAVRVTDADDADVFLVPFMASQAFNCDRKEHFLRHNFQDICGSLYRKDHALQAELKSWLEAQPPWQRSGGIDHVVLAIHPLALNRIDDFLAPAIHLLVDFVFKHSSKASLEKDVIVPHSHLVEWLPDDQVGMATSERFLETADILLYFAGVLDRKGMGKLRSSLREVLINEPDVVITGPRAGAGQGDLNDTAIGLTAATMRRSKFCLDPAGDTPSSSRLFDAIVNLCIPVIISDDLEIPFEGQLDLSQSCIFVSEADAVQPGLLVSKLRAVSDEEVLRRKRELAKIREHYTYIDSWRRKGSAQAMIWREIAARLPTIKLRMARRARGVERRHASTYDKLDPSRLMKADQ
ncbi:hypothetical protein KFL_000090310 [Klebsormidium nitens]|uniref:Exostosin GT47 domain-containing protein n=1 Tax=Klebsormidium nitens TaxID=105231 RepID=A0A1Y1HNJ8_KLENI|nr:hypothetical protein KFL_000090310 [Klebsormidium nitens]|eukprot:GAQ78186.1 hypothetical protein KFL_000090310 [Klebsormidium nitens]